ncbi:beta-glucosidase [Microbacterium halimionae]|uniref:Beta-glucosidase n=1 Tax=Microbacterium halimionae TaxID=1526413 RepID=A0A7W3JPR9_9MICO|nr:family 1 glycosylhydrolase [Microbacterium halimionae]MBA8816743.1 beta-glucosidase [Microbacterium halimionae]NII94961.1 beta-glucosidase [Microbacterium halimionae]
MTQFPSDFLWGAATAAHQIEGNNVNSDWWEREHAPGTDVAQPSGDAADSFHRFPEDIALLSERGFNVYRFSIEWARIEPEPGFISKAMLQHYRRMIEGCLAAGLKPMVTLHHFTTPRWFAHRGGWRAADAPELFIRYVETVLPILRDVEWICDINEPNMVAMTRGEEGTEMAAAALPSPDALITERLIESHHRAREVLSTLPALSGWSIAGQAFHAAPGGEEEMRAYRYPREDVFLEASRGDGFIGVQAYLRTFIGKDGPLPVPEGTETTLTGWEYFPQALEICSRHAWDLTRGVPQFVTENGIATADDERRKDYTFGALSGLGRAMADGIDVRGYLHWSLLDNYEWGSFDPTFGLVGFNPDTFERQPKPSIDWLAQIARTGNLAR